MKRDTAAAESRMEITKGDKSERRQGGSGVQNGDHEGEQE